MKHKTKRILSLVLMLVLIMSITVPAFAAASIWTPTEPITLFRTRSSGTSTVYFDIATSWENFTIKRSSVKVIPGDTGAKMVSFHKNITLYQGQFLNESGTWDKKDTGNGYHYRVGIQVSNKGTATVKYKIGNENYSFKAKVLNYKNPVKTITLTGINGGKNFAWLTKETTDPAPVMLPATAKNAKLTVKAIDGWSIKQIYIEDSTTGQFRVLGNNSGMTSGTINWGTLNAKHNYFVEAQIYNIKYDFTQYIQYSFNGANAA